MALIKRRERDAHWYHKNGDPCHTVIAKTTGLPRQTNLTDARKLGLIPSVTNILSMKSKPALDVWKLDKSILAALNLEKKPGESHENFLSRIAEESEAETKKAAAWGTAIHEQIEQYCTQGAFLGTGEILDYVACFDTWYRANVVEVISAEQSVVGSLGYAGRLDLHAMIQYNGETRRAIIDAKSQKLKGKADGNFYKEWSMQLAAYADCTREEGEPLPLLVSLLIPSDNPGPIQMKVWDNGLDALDAFHACFRLWCFEKGYRP
ncbi:hypothetical protein JIN85_19795 [Luteolibacter pohnpeiensis]|uniref:Uncharacterized protein n=1 Tax=Luteolibacter pohnpeiensis TaxID=454153 RepID=A0A934SEZ0_9BACT|nr:hypothetical protein [Luteolibacter pohnpeiensis]MBK1884664.1 hypothetical protein [Luteolibacter pohnpeiensis]